MDRNIQLGRSPLPWWSVEDSLLIKYLLIANRADGEKFAAMAGTSSGSTTRQAFRDQQFFDRYLIRDEYFAVNVNAVIIDFIVTYEMFEVIRLDEITDFLMNFSHRTLQIGFLALAMAAKETYFAGVYDSGDVITLLK